MILVQSNGKHMSTDQINGDKYMNAEDKKLNKVGCRIMIKAVVFDNTMSSESDIILDMYMACEPTSSATMDFTREIIRNGFRYNKMTSSDGSLEYEIVPPHRVKGIVVSSRTFGVKLMNEFGICML